jgi:hypothetical protein
LILKVSKGVDAAPSGNLVLSLDSENEDTALFHLARATLDGKFPAHTKIDNSR